MAVNNYDRDKDKNDNNNPTPSAIKGLIVIGLLIFFGAWLVWTLMGGGFFKLFNDQQQDEQQVRELEEQEQQTCLSGEPFWNEPLQEWQCINPP